MQNWILSETVELSRPREIDLRVVPLMHGDVGALCWRVRVVREGVGVPLGSACAFGVFLRADGSRVAVAGAVEGDVCQICLSADCCAVTGLLRGALRLTLGDETVTLSERVFRVSNVTDGDTLAPGDTLPTLSALQTDVGALSALAEDLSTRVGRVESRADAWAVSGADVTNETTLFSGTVNGTGGAMALSQAATDFDALIIEYGLNGVNRYEFSVQPQSLMKVSAFSIAPTPESNAIEQFHAQMQLRLSADARTISVESASWVGWTGAYNNRATCGTVQNGAAVSAAGAITRVLGRRNLRMEEVADLRVGIGGATYATAGESVRSQLGALRSDASALSARLDMGGAWTVKQLIDLLCPRVAAAGRAVYVDAVPGYPLRVTASAQTQLRVCGANLLGGGTVADALNALPDGKYTLSCEGAIRLETALGGAMQAEPDAGGVSTLCFERSAAAQGVFTAAQVGENAMLNVGETALPYAPAAAWQTVTADALGAATVSALNGGTSVFAGAGQVSVEGRGVPKEGDA